MLNNLCTITRWLYNNRLSHCIDCLCVYRSVSVYNISFLSLYRSRLSLMLRLYISIKSLWPMNVISSLSISTSRSLSLSLPLYLSFSLSLSLYLYLYTSLRCRLICEHLDTDSWKTKKSPKLFHSRSHATRTSLLAAMCDSLTKFNSWLFIIIYR